MTNARSNLIVNIWLDLPSINVLLSLTTQVVIEVVQDERLENVTTANYAEKDVRVGMKTQRHQNQIS